MNGKGLVIMDVKDLTEEQKAKAIACKTPEKMLAFAKDEGFELSDEDLEGIAGGEDTWDCPRICNQ